MNKKTFLFVLLLVLCFFSKAQENSNKQNTKPKLVIGIVVDQMRYDYLTRFFDKYGNGGFKRLMNEGFNCKNNHFNYIPTKTGPGHASVFTGTTPKYHGIIANDWYDKESKDMVYCASDGAFSAVGTHSEAERMSPHRMKSTTFADENRLFTQMRGKSIGISIKDRGAVLSAGHSANAAYWFRGKDEGNFISSSYYMQSLPKWVKDFNASKKAESYLKQWQTLYDISKYTESGDDLNNFEGGFRGKETATFPYDLKTLYNTKENAGFDILKYTPYGNSIVVDFTIEAVKAEALGKDNYTDILTVSFSSTDYIGHNFGVNSKEIEDTYIRLDKDLERFFRFLDTEIGIEQYTLFLTSDHGVVDVPAYLKSVKIPAGYINRGERKEKFQAFLTKTFGTTEVIENISNNQIFLNREKIKQLGLDLSMVQEAIVNEQITYPNIAFAYSATTMQTSYFNDGIESLLQKGYNQKYSGDILLVDDISYLAYGKTGTNHGSGFSYDTHVPLLFFGNGIKHGATFKKTEITDIAPTISALLGISFPNACIGQPLEFVLENN